MKSGEYAARAADIPPSLSLSHSSSYDNVKKMWEFISQILNNSETAERNPKPNETKETRREVLK